MLGAINPLLLWGAALISVPILIHLLSRRKFKIVNWAAMEFLLAADRRNRRRVQLEQLLLLILRCLAIILLACMVARLFVQPSGALAGAFGGGSIEHVVVLDDSPSMSVRIGSRTAFTRAREGLGRFVEHLSRDRGGDSISVFVTSRPNEPVVSGRYLNEAQLGDITKAIADLRVSDARGDLNGVLTALQQTEAEDSSVERMVYILSDCRQGDWVSDKAAATLQESLGTLRQKSQGLMLIDVAEDSDGNLLIAAIQPQEKTIAAGVPVRYDVVVNNAGRDEVNDVEVVFTAADGTPQRGRIDSIAPGAQAAIPFTYVAHETGSVALQAELPADALLADNKHHFAARVRAGVDVLVVDGDPSSTSSEAESFYVNRALSPPGEAVSGNVVQVVSENRFEGLDLSHYQVVVLANVYRLSEERIASIADWVAAGGGLVVALGDQIDQVSYNELMLPAGLIPARLEEVAGDESRRTWANFTLEATQHPILEIYAGTDNPFLQRVKIFRWWHSTLPEELLADGRATVLARLTGEQASPALVEGRHGKGRTLLTTLPLDADWSNWPTDSSFVVAALEMARYVARADVDSGTVLVDAVLEHPIDSSRFEHTATWVAAEAEEGTPLEAVPAADGGGMAFQLAPLRQSGFYQLQLQRRDGEQEVLRYAANVDPREGALERVDARDFGARLRELDVEFVDGLDALGTDVEGAGFELWRWLAVLLLAVLFCEQFLAWTFGRRR